MGSQTRMKYIDTSQLNGDLILQNGLTGETYRCGHNQLGAPQFETVLKIE
jgi:hypothetical protein